MIQERSILNVADNSGAKTIRCFRILGATRRRYARIGDLIIASVQVAEPRKEVKKKDIVRAVIVRSRYTSGRNNGTYIRFGDNAAVLVNDKNEPRSTRILGPIPRELREKGFEKIYTMAEEVV